MFKLTLQAEEKLNYMTVKEYEISYPFNKITQNEIQDVYYSLENVEHENIKGNYYIFYCKKMGLNNENFLGATSKVKADAGWLTNTSVLNKEGRQSFNPIVEILTIKEIRDDVIRRDSDILNVEQYVLLEQKFFQFINLKNINKTQKLKTEFPKYLIRTLDDVNRDFQFFIKYEDHATNGYTTNEKVTLYFRLYKDL